MHSDLLDGMVPSNKTLMEVSGGEVVTTSSLLPAGSVVVTEETVEEYTEPSDEVVEMEPNKVWTLADGTLVTPDDTLTTNATTITESNTTATPQENDLVEDSPSAAATEEEATLEEVPPVLDGANEVAWAQLGAIPNFDESISEMEVYKSTISSSETVAPPIPLYDTTSDIVNAKRKYDGEDLEDEDIFEPFEIEWFDEVGPDGQEYREYFVDLCLLSTLFTSCT